MTAAATTTTTEHVSLDASHSCTQHTVITFRVKDEKKSSRIQKFLTRKSSTSNCEIFSKSLLLLHCCSISKTIKTYENLFEMKKTTAAVAASKEEKKTK